LADVSAGLGTVFADFAEEAELFLETGLGCGFCPAHSTGIAIKAHGKIQRCFLILNLAKGFMGKYLRLS
jgi:hypothetical protein